MMLLSKRCCCYAIDADMLLALYADYMSRTEYGVTLLCYVIENRLLRRRLLRQHAFTPPPAAFAMPRSTLPLPPFLCRYAQRTCLLATIATPRRFTLPLPCRLVIYVEAPLMPMFDTTMLLRMPYAAIRYDTVRY